MMTESAIDLRSGEVHFFVIIVDFFSSTILIRCCLLPKIILISMCIFLSKLLMIFFVNTNPHILQIDLELHLLYFEFVKD